MGAVNAMHAIVLIFDIPTCQRDLENTKKIPVISKIIKLTKNSFKSTVINILMVRKAPIIFRRGLSIELSKQLNVGIGGV